MSDHPSGCLRFGITCTKVLSTDTTTTTTTTTTVLVLVLAISNSNRGMPARDCVPKSLQYLLLLTTTICELSPASKESIPRYPEVFLRHS